MLKQNLQLAVDQARDARMTVLLALRDRGLGRLDPEDQQGLWDAGNRLEVVRDRLQEIVDALEKAS